MRTNNLQFLNSAKIVPAIILMFFFFSNSIFSVTSIGTNGQAGTHSTLGGHDVGQSFTATITGTLKSIKVGETGGHSGADYTLKVYAGAGTGGSELHVQTGASLPTTVTGLSTYTLTTITLDATVNITSGNVYTFVFTPATSIDLLYAMSNIYADGALVSADNGGVIAGADMIFEVDQENELPVELTSFTAEISGNLVELNWSTATEINNYGFEVERLESETEIKNSCWSTIGFIEGAGNSNSPKNYSFIDGSNVTGKTKYRLKQIDNDGTYEYSKEVEVLKEMPGEFSLHQNYPNPFNPSTTIEFILQEKAMINLAVFNSIGQEVKVLLNETMEPGKYSKKFNAEKFNSGIYFYRLSVGDKFTSVKKMLLIK